MVTGSSGGSPTMGRAPRRVVDLGEASGTVGLAWEASHRHGGGLGQWLGLGQDFMKLRITGALFIGGKWPKM
jgi:hypothetical protein